MGDLKEWIKETLHDPLKRQPWTKTKNPEEIVGKCVECQPDVATLFGEVKEGRCTSYVCWERKMDAWIAELAKSHKAKKVSTQYGQPKKGILSRSEYTIVGKKSCETAKEGIVAEGSDIGKVVRICEDKACPTHYGQNAHYDRTPAEKARAKKEREKAKEEIEKKNAEILKSIGRVKFPMSEAHLNALYDMVLRHAGMSQMQPVLKRHGVKPGTVTEHGYTSRDYEGPIRKIAEGEGKNGKLRMIFELMIPDYMGEDELKKELKKL